MESKIWLLVASILLVFGIANGDKSTVSCTKAVEGGKLVCTCSPGGSDTAGADTKWNVASTDVAADSPLLGGTNKITYTKDSVTVADDHGKEVKCTIVKTGPADTDQSDAATTVVEAVKAATITCNPAPNNAGVQTKCTCASGNQAAPTKYKFTVSGVDKTASTSNELDYTVLTTDNDKDITCVAIFAGDVDSPKATAVKMVLSSTGDKSTVSCTKAVEGGKLVCTCSPGTGVTAGADTKWDVAGTVMAANSPLLGGTNKITYTKDPVTVADDHGKKVKCTIVKAGPADTTQSDEASTVVEAVKAAKITCTPTPNKADVQTKCTCASGNQATPTKYKFTVSGVDKTASTANELDHTVLATDKDKDITCVAIFAGDVDSLKATAVKMVFSSTAQGKPTLEGTQAKAGSDLTVTCKAADTGETGLKYNWYQTKTDGTATKLNNNPTTDAKYTLPITKQTEGAAGYKYQCDVVNAAGTSEKSDAKEVKYDSSIQGKPTLEGAKDASCSNFEVTCKAANAAQTGLTYNWYQIKPDGTTDGLNTKPTTEAKHTLPITDQAQGVAGYKYQCDVVNSAGTSVKSDAKEVKYDSSKECGAAKARASLMITGFLFLLTTTFLKE